MSDLSASEFFISSNKQRMQNSKQINSGRSNKPSMVLTTSSTDTSGRSDRFPTSHSFTSQNTVLLSDRLSNKDK